MLSTINIRFFWCTNNELNNINNHKNAAVINTILTKYTSTYMIPYYIIWLLYNMANLVTELFNL